jgi:hypothetical protein
LLLKVAENEEYNWRSITMIEFSLASCYVRHGPERRQRLLLEASDRKQSISTGCWVLSLERRIFAQGFQIKSSKGCLCKVGSFQIGILKVGTRQDCILKNGSAERASPEIGAIYNGIREIGSVKVGVFSTKP